MIHTNLSVVGECVWSFLTKCSLLSLSLYEICEALQESTQILFFTAVFDGGVNIRISSWHKNTVYDTKFITVFNALRSPY